MQIGRRYQHWSTFRIGIVLLFTSKVIAIPLGIVLLVAGLVLADLEISLVGVSSLAFVYAAQVGSWNGATRLAFLLRWCPDVFSLERWHVDGKGEARVFGKNDTYQRSSHAINRLLSRASEEDSDSILGWGDEFIIAMLAIKFVALTGSELFWIESPGKPSLAELLDPQSARTLSRWEKGWMGQPGIWVRQWTSFQPGPPSAPALTQATPLLPAVPASTSPSASNAPASMPVAAGLSGVEGSAAYEKTLRFVVVIFECIRRSRLSSEKEQRRNFLDVLRVQRDGNMTWFSELVRRCLEGDHRAIDRSVGP